MRRRSSCGALSRTSRPAITTAPASGSTSRFTSFSVVVLPQPEAPTSNTHSPRATSSETPSTASAPA